MKQLMKQTNHDWNYFFYKESFLSAKSEKASSFRQYQKKKKKGKPFYKKYILHVNTLKPMKTDKNNWTKVISKSCNIAICMYNGKEKKKHTEALFVNLFVAVLSFH